jgi:hypothetical protein
MPMQILTPRRHEVHTRHSLSFRFSNTGSGFGFECHEDGTIFPLTNEAARINYAACLAGNLDGREITPEGVVTSTSHYTAPAEGKCDECRALVSLSGFTNTCECGAEYNMSGQRLAPRSQWGEETGEQF